MLLLRYIWRLGLLRWTRQPLIVSHSQGDSRETRPRGVVPGIVRHFEDCTQPIQCGGAGMSEHEALTRFRGLAGQERPQTPPRAAAQTASQLSHTGRDDSRERQW